ncbi:MAG TPA: hypothetical protein VNU68_33345 [Verrucomicrobiae bacterium]|nr:hypothetical protein [Verrucomicrobiae bacterium]
MKAHLDHPTPTWVPGKNIRTHPAHTSSPDEAKPIPPILFRARHLSRATERTHSWYLAATATQDSDSLKSA